MPTFEIPDGPTTIEAARSGDPKNPQPAETSAVYSVTNKTSDSVAGRLSVQVTGSTKAEWFTIDGERERTFGPGETQTATVKVKFPPEVAAGDYAFRLRAVAVNDPDNDHAEGPVTTAKLGGVAVIEKSKWWLWLLLGLLALIAIGAGIYFAFLRKDDPPDNQVAVPTFVDKTVDQAKAEAGSFKIVEVPGEPSGKAPGMIVAQDPAAATLKAPGTEVRVTVDPGIDVPQLANRGIGTIAAVNELARAKLRAGAVTPVCQRSGQSGEVIGQNPAPPRKAPLNGDVQLSVRALNGVLEGQRVRCGMKIDPRKIASGVIHATPVSEARPLSRRDGAVVRDHRTRREGDR